MEQDPRVKLAPLPTSLDDAIIEIYALRKQLINQGERHAKMAERQEITIRSLKGMVKQLEVQIGRLKNGDV